MTRRDHTDRTQTTAPADAAGWVARMGSDQRTRDDERALAEWTGGDPAQAAAYASHARLWDSVGALSSDPEARALLRGETIVRLPVHRRTLFAALAGAVAAGVAGVIVAPRVAELGGFYRTARGEQRRIRLADGSELTLDTATRLRVRFTDGERRLTLESGQAHFRVAKDAARPFRVFVGATEVRAIGTSFGVRKDGDAARVTLEEGVVAVYRGASTAPVQPAAEAPAQHRPAAPKPAVILQPGQQAKIEPAAPVQIASVDLRREQAWRFGRMVLDSAPLSEAVEEINRYGGRRIVLADPALGDIRVSGVFHTGRPEAFVEAMTTGFGVRLSHEDDRELVLAPA